MITILLLTILVAFTILGVFKSYRKYQFFKERNVKHFKPIPIFGNAFEVLSGKRHLSEKLDELYRAFPEEELLGHYDLTGPQVVVRSPELADSILAKNFSHFQDRLLKSGKIQTPEDANLFVLTGNTWRAVRNKFSPLFTSGKLKFMYQSMADCGNNLVALLEEKEEEEVEISNVMSLFSIDVIGSTAFGLEANVLRNPNTKFREMAGKIIFASLFRTLKVAFFILTPKIAKMVGIRGIVNRDVGEYFFGIIRNTLRERKEKGITRNDFVQMLLQLEQKEKIEVQIHDSGDDYLFQEKTNETFELEVTDNLLVGGAFSFFLAGFHATAVTLTYVLFELAQHPEVDAKLREEIASVVQGKDPTYDELKKMSYLESVIKESLRLHPVAPAVGRVCTKEFTSPGGFVFKPGQLVTVPLKSLQTDPAYWPDPLVFNPNRFPQDFQPLPGTYLPFGAGPRICIAMRLAMLEMKFALVKLLMKYKFHLSEKTKLPLRTNPRLPFAAPADGVYLRLNRIK